MKMKDRTIDELNLKHEWYWNCGWEANMMKDNHLANRCSTVLDLIEAELDRRLGVIDGMTHGAIKGDTNDD